MLRTLTRASLLLCLALPLTPALTGCASGGAAPAPLTTAAVQSRMDQASDEVDLALAEVYDMPMSDVRLRLEVQAKELSRQRDQLAATIGALSDGAEGLSALRKRASALLKAASDLRTEIKDATS